MACENPPNILLIMTDQHRWNCLGCHDHPIVKTPHIDALAQNGVDFRRCYSQSAICMPSRLSLFTGQYIHTHGVMVNTPHAQIDHLITLPNILRANGYQTAAIGKTHCGNMDTIGFEYSRLCAGLSAGETNDYSRYLLDQGYTPARTEVGNSENPDEIDNWTTFEQHITDEDYKTCDTYSSTISYRDCVETWTGSESIQFLKQRDTSRPFFLWTTFQRPHPPLCLPPDCPHTYDPDDITLPDYDVRFYNKPDSRRPGVENCWNVYAMGEQQLRRAIANYYSLISMIDDQVGRIIQHLEETGQLENTIVIFTADHGEFCGEFGQFGKNISTYDVLYQIPMIWHWKGHTGHENMYELVEMVDVMPTLLELVDIPIPRTVQGQSLATPVLSSNRRITPFWTGKDEVFFETVFTKTVRTATHKLSYCYNGDRRWGQLYDLDKDPAEEHNLYENPQVKDIQMDLHRRLTNWLIISNQPQWHGSGVYEAASPNLWYQADGPCTAHQYRQGNK